ncbi:MAG: DEAD/DEAH box helicase, partial [Candidatus Sumerlaeia bacterium]|nr:DEAD/DEAH box helicase [Candidatus Sumerlaeia bacterium]
MSSPPPIEGDSTHYFTREAALTCAEEIRQAGGVEVFFIGRRGEDGLVREVESHAFGTDNCVPALTHLADPGDVIIHNHPSGHLLPSGADLSIAAPMGNLGVGFYIVNNDASRCRVVVKAEVPRKKVPVEETEISRRLSMDGNLSRIVTDFEDRPQQQQMSLAVARAFNKDGIVVVEAGTGTGKSLAYLLPSVLFSMKNKDRVVISTNTINLQEQLLHKDIPALRQAMGLEDFDVEIVKGRSNYVCRRKAGFAAIEADTLLEDDYIRELKQVLNWIDASETGDRQDLPFITRDEVWERVQSES